MDVTRRFLFGLFVIPLFCRSKSAPIEPVEIVIGRDDVTGIPFKRDVEEVVEQHPKEWYRTNHWEWNRHEWRSGPYIPLPDGRKIPVRLSWS